MQKKKKKIVAPIPRVAKRKRRSRKDLLDRIVQAAHEEFKRYGFTGATTAAIARNASVTEAQLFRYFGSKSNLFRETIFKPIDQHLVNFNKNLDKTRHIGSPKEENHLYTTELQRFISEHSEMFTLLALTQKYDFVDAHGVGKINSLSTYFEHAAVGMARRMTNELKVDPKVLVRVTFAAVLGCIMFKDWIFPAGLASDEEITAAINDFVLEGISANYDGAAQIRPR